MKIYIDFPPKLSWMKTTLCACKWNNFGTRDRRPTSKTSIQYLHVSWGNDNNLIFITFPFSTRNVGRSKAVGSRDRFRFELLIGMSYHSEKITRRAERYEWIEAWLGVDSIEASRAKLWPSPVGCWLLRGGLHFSLPRIYPRIINLWWTRLEQESYSWI